MNATETETAPDQKRRLGTLGFALDKQLKDLQQRCLGENAYGKADAKAALARLRRGLGKPAGSVPEIWDLTLDVIPESLRWDGPGPGRAEQAAHSALTLYAFHQQSQPAPMHLPDVSFGRAVGALRYKDERSEQAVTRRFMAVATAESPAEALEHMRRLVRLLRSAQQGFDYARLADGLLGLLTPGEVTRVRLAWGRDFYRAKADTDASSEHDNDSYDEQ